MSIITFNLSRCVELADDIRRRKVNEALSIEKDPQTKLTNDVMLAIPGFSEKATKKREEVLARNNEVKDFVRNHATTKDEIKVKTDSL